ncbi:alpha-xylosidase [Clostridia bacterium]|nr:alpha-xylosidase [Clostridia bacterium]
MKISNYHFLGEQTDVSQQFKMLGSIHFNVQSIEGFDSETGRGQLKYARYERKGRLGFNMYSAPFEASRSWAFPPDYTDEPLHPFEMRFVSEDTVRIRVACSPMGAVLDDSQSLILERSPDYIEAETVISDDSHTVYRTAKMEAEVQYNPFKIAIRDLNGRELTRTLHQTDSFCLQNYNPLPFSYVKSAEDMRKYTAISMAIHPNEHFYGCGESFTRLDKLGQRVILWTKDASGVETDEMYKPVPFYMSSRGYGVFLHSSCPMTLDFGHEYAEAQTIYSADENIDMFIFAGPPKQVLGSYTSLTGRSPVPPVWSFGLWMSRITYKSEEEVRAVAAKLREYRIPCDVIHLDTGWFENDWRCDYEFSVSRFEDAKKMIEDLKRDGFRICLWQLPYFTPGNKLYKEIVENGLNIGGAAGLPTDDAILDFSNPETVKWYQSHLQTLLEMGVTAIKADFGEAAPVFGRYHSGDSGVKEHNLYPLRYNKAVFDITRQITGEGIIWGRSAWAGSQRFPIHWGGDSENTDMGMLSSLRGGLSFGASGFSFWSQDAGGFVRTSPEELYRRWMFMSIFCSHIRCHGQPPKEPWEYSESFLCSFRAMVELRYSLMPYIAEQAADCSKLGLPMVRAMFIEHPSDPACVDIDDQYYFGSDMIIAPLFEPGSKRTVYLPEGRWVGFSSGISYEGKAWREAETDKYPGLAFVKAGAEIPMADTAQCTDRIDWEHVRRVRFG